jgi:hypothetical protein
MKFRKIHIAGALALVLCAAPALADTSVGGGVFWSHDGNTDPGLLASHILMGLPGVPVKIQASAAVPIGAGGRYAVTGEGMYRFRKFYAGAGAGFGKMDVSGATGLIFDYFGGFRLAPLTSIQGRYYGSLIGSPGSSTYLGVAFSLK